LTAATLHRTLQTDFRMNEPSTSALRKASEVPADVLLRAERWLAEHGDALYRVALGRTRNAEVARDLVQETLLAGMRHWSQYSQRSSEAAWLMGILRNKIVDHFRRQSREQTFTDLEFLADDRERFFDQRAKWSSAFGPKPWPGPDEAYERAEFWRAFDHCLSRLPERVAQVFLLRELDGIASEDICKEFDVSPNNFWVMLYRARMALRHCLEKNWFKRDEQ
jgi:RNA polymerase sigma-70 factor (ECF subfamily)